ncbi:type IV secretion protein Rhs [Taibaiella sp. KBW10]|uniref:DUF6531 domain-containing protein n=1 Tax=Taibaiella sp. KBW10 TaxID=2153357 RepID=UPI000F5926DD|nr:DUF6531 domain-containing protein [Taibaiella sp. KBW10]RQO29718.1 type IV secretion protein Rhs [Taibaiella sp. KBW10]
MLLTDNHFTPVIGIDIHFTTLPPFNPFHPYIGLVLDPMDYVPFIGGTVHVNGIKRGVSDTSGIIIPLVHIPLFTPPWVMTPIIGHESTNFFASQNSYADGSRLSPKGYMVMTCNDIGIPLSLQPGKKKFWKVVPTLFAPTSFSLPIPTGAPVNVGGPYVPDWGGMLKNMVMGFGFGAIMKYGKKLFNKLLKNAVGPNWLSRALCHAGFEPVNFVNGAVVYDGTDFSLPGPIPFDWKRSWYSDSDYQGMLGHGCHWQYDREIQYYPEEEALGLRMPDGRVVAFPNLAVGDAFYLRQEKVTLKRYTDHFEAIHHEENLSYLFTPQTTGYYKLTRITNESNCAIHLEYQGKLLKKITDSAGRNIMIDTDASGRILAATISIGPLEERKVAYAYDAAGNMTTITDALGQSTRIQYTGYEMVKKTDRNGQSFYWVYDELGRCTHTWGDGGLQEGWLEYHPEKGYNKITDATGATTIYHYDENQLVQRIVNPLGGTKIFQYTEYMEHYREVDEDGNITGYTYTDKGYLSGIHYPDGTAKQFLYDEQDRLLVNISPGGSQEVFTYYEDSKLVRAVIHPDRSVTQYQYNDAGLPEHISRGVQSLNLHYDRFYNLIELSNEAGLRTQWQYSLLGEVLHVIDTEGSILRYRYDDLGRVIAIVQPDGNQQQLHYNAYDEVTELDRNGETIATFDYTPLGSLVKSRQGGTQVRFQYDKMERLTKVVNEHHETYTFSRNAAGDIIAETGFDELTRHYLRSAAGRVLGIKGPGGQHTRYRYNGKGQISYAEYADGSWESYSYDKDGLLIAAQNEHSYIALKRDNNGRIVSETQRRGIADKGHTITSVYDDAGQRGHIGSTLGADITQQYNQLGQLNHIQARNGEQLWETHITRNTRGQATAYAFTGGVHSNFAYDSSGRPIAHTVQTGTGRESYKRSYQWNAANQLVQSINQLNRQAITYGYDALNQLVSAKPGGNEIEFKTPDEVGNLYETPDRTDRAYTRGGRLDKDQRWHYYYDTLGNLELQSPFPLHGKDPGKKWQPGCRHYTWYANGMLKCVQKPDGSRCSFEYDALGRRAAKITGNRIIRYLWEGNVLLQEWDYDTAERPQLLVGALGELFYDKAEPTENITTWVYEEGNFSPIAKLINGERFSIVSDYLGTPIQAFDSNGALIWERELNIYGGVRKETGIANFVAMRYQGQYFDAETGLCYNRFRYYDPNSGLYLSQDPIRLRGGLALYGYVHDTNNWLDVLGLSEGSGTLGRNMNKAGMTHNMNPFVRGDFQAHHVIPHEVWVGNQQFFDDIGLGGAKDLANNGVYLPKNEGIANQHGFDYYHRGSHPDINDDMELKVKSVSDRFNNNQISKTKARKEISKIQKAERARLSKRTHSGNPIKCH